MTTQWLHSLDDISVSLNSMRDQMSRLITGEERMSWAEINIITSIQCLADAVELIHESIIQDK